MSTPRAVPSTTGSFFGSSPKTKAPSPLPMNPISANASSATAAATGSPKSSLPAGSSPRTRAERAALLGSSSSFFGGESLTSGSSSSGLAGNSDARNVAGSAKSLGFSSPPPKVSAADVTASPIPLSSGGPSRLLTRLGSRGSRRNLQTITVQSNSVQFDTSTILEGFLFLGAKGVLADREKLRAMRITSIVSVIDDTPYEPADGIRVQQVCVGDSPTENISKYFHTVCQFIEYAREHGSAVLVHCNFGMSRSTSFVLAYLVKHQGYTLAQAISHVKERRPVASPNTGFMAQLCAFEKNLLGRTTVDVEKYATDRFGEVSSYAIAR